MLPGKQCNNFKFQEKVITMGYKAKFLIPSSTLLCVTIVSLVSDKQYWGLQSVWLETIMKYLLEKTLLSYSITHERTRMLSEALHQSIYYCLISLSCLFYGSYINCCLFFLHNKWKFRVRLSKLMCQNHATTTQMIWLNSAFSSVFVVWQATLSV